MHPHAETLLNQHKNAAACLINPLAAVFLLPFTVHGINFLQTFTWHGFSFSMFTVWHGLSFLVLMFSGLWIEALPPTTLHSKSINTFLNRRTSRFNFCSYVLNPAQINIVFFRLKVGRNGVELSAICATIVKFSGSIYRPSVLILKVYWADLSANRSQRVKANKTKHDLTNTRSSHHKTLNEAEQVSFSYLFYSVLGARCLCLSFLDWRSHSG